MGLLSRPTKTLGVSPAVLRGGLGEASQISNSTLKAIHAIQQKVEISHLKLVFINIGELVGITYTYAYLYVHIYIYICICVCRAL